MADTMRGTVAKRDAGTTPDLNPQEQAVKDVERELEGAVNWFRRVAPSHVNPEQFTALCIGAIRRGDWQLQRALWESPRSFMAAVSECAQLGLVPGETYHFVAFRNTIRSPEDGSERKVYECTGIVDYRGELDQIYRAGAVTAVICDVVRESDTFIWRRGEMDTPHHVIRSEGSEHVGLADDTERGYLAGAYAYAKMAAGGYSDVIVMHRSEIAKHQAVAKTDRFWGPPWPHIVEKTQKESPWTPEMYLKTVLHRLFDRVPHSAEYLAGQIRSAAAAQREPLEGRPARPPVSGGTGMLALPEGNGKSPAGEPAGDEPPPKPEPKPGDRARRAAFTRINKLFEDNGISVDQVEVRRAVITGLLARDGEPAAYVNLATSDAATAKRAADALDKAIREVNASEDDRPVAEVLTEMAAQVDRWVDAANQPPDEPEGQEEP